MSFAKLRPKLGATGALIALFVAAAQPVLAKDIASTPRTNEVRVHYSDLNLQSALGAEALVNRIARAAKEACGGRPPMGPGHYAERVNYAACLEQAQHSAVAAVNKPSVTAAYARRQSGVVERIATR